MVGACADWFAIVALFRRPFGLPIPHTGIVPNNKDRIGGALGRFITNNFLTASAMNERLARIDVLGSLGRWISEPSNAKRLGEYAARSVAAGRKLASCANSSASPSATSRDRRWKQSRPRQWLRDC